MSKEKKDMIPGMIHLKEYKNLKELAEIVSLHTDRVLKTSVLKLPQKLYKKVYFEMTKKQTAYYNQTEGRTDYRVKGRSLYRRNPCHCPVVTIATDRLRVFSFGYR